MNYRLFFEKYHDKTDGKRRHYGNLITDGSGNFWSYGDHYPLRVNLGGGLFLLNESGYSVTTSKHIGLARRYCQVSYDPHLAGMPGLDEIIAHDPVETRQRLKMVLSTQNAKLKAMMKVLRKNATRKRDTYSARIAKNGRNLFMFKKYPIKQSNNE